MADMDSVYREYARPVYRYLYSLCGDAALAEELCAETFYRAVGAVGRYDGSSKLLTWLCSIGKNVWREECRSRAKRAEAPLPEDIGTGAPGLELAGSGAAGSAAGPQAAAERGAERVALYRALQGLDPATREVMYLRLTGELGYREIGEILGRSENWARVTFYRGKEKLAKGGLLDDWKG